MVVQNICWHILLDSLEASIKEKIFSGLFVRFFSDVKF